jgi:hypothetical protein
MIETLVSVAFWIAVLVVIMKAIKDCINPE